VKDEKKSCSALLHYIDEWDSYLEVNWMTM